VNTVLANRPLEVGATTESDRRAELASVFETEAAFRTWYDTTAPRVYGYLYGRCGGDTALAEELTQQTFVAAVRARRGFDGRSDPITWIIAIARNRLVDHYRKRARDERRHLRVVVGEVTREPRTAEAPWPVDDRREEVLAALRGLPAEQRAALILHHVDGLSVREVSHQLGRSSSAVESLLARARRRFRQLYEVADHD
jgi:RNA polymerase sigma-70 factor, ECF subfamily